MGLDLLSKPKICSDDVQHVLVQEQIVCVGPCNTKSIIEGDEFAWLTYFQEVAMFVIFEVFKKLIVRKIHSDTLFRDSPPVESYLRRHFNTCCFNLEVFWVKHLGYHA